MLTLGSLFDGAGTIPFAAKLCGIKPVWSSEIETFPCEVTAKRFPDMVQLGDIIKIDGRKIEPVDIITFGSPCQDLSLAGKRVGLGGERSGLFMEAIRIIKEMRDETSRRTDGIIRPRYAVWENVPGAFSSNKGEDFRTVLEEFCKVKAEGTVVPRPAGGGGTLAGTSWVTGIPLHGESSMHAFGEYPRIVEESGLSQILEEEVPLKYFLSAVGCRGVLRRAEKRGKALPGILETALNQQIERWEKFGTPLPKYRGLIRETALVCKPIGFNHRNGSKSHSVAETVDGAPTLRASTDTAVVYCLMGNCIDRADSAKCNGCGVKEGESYTLNTVDKHGVCYAVGNGQVNQLGLSECARTLSCMHDQQAVLIKMAPIYLVRRLTPLECCRLQGMPDWWIDGTNGSDAAQYKMWGNGMALPNALYVMEGFAEIEGGLA